MKMRMIMCVVPLCRPGKTVAGSEPKSTVSSLGRQFSSGPKENARREGRELSMRHRLVCACMTLALVMALSACGGARQDTADDPPRVSLDSPDGKRLLG